MGFGNNSYHTMHTLLRYKDSILNGLQQITSASRSPEDLEQALISRLQQLSTNALDQLPDLINERAGCPWMGIAEHYGAANLTGIWKDSRNWQLEFELYGGATRAYTLSYLSALDKFKILQVLETV